MEHIPTIGITKNTPKEKVLELAKTDCGTCGFCCKFGGGFVLKEEVQKISDFLGITEKEFTEKYLTKSERFNTTLLRIRSEKTDKNYGPCIFLDERKGCLIHEVKPLYCKLGTCKGNGQELSLWFTLNYFVNPDNPESIRQYALYLKTHPTIPGGKLHEIVPDKEKLKKILNFEIFK